MPRTLPCSDVALIVYIAYNPPCRARLYHYEWYEPTIARELRLAEHVTADLGGGHVEPDAQRGLLAHVGDLNPDLVAIIRLDARRDARLPFAVRLCENDELHAGRLLADAGD